MQIYFKILRNEFSKKSCSGIFSVRWNVYFTVYLCSFGKLLREERLFDLLPLFEEGLARGGLLHELQAVRPVQYRGQLRLKSSKLALGVGSRLNTKHY